MKIIILLIITAALYSQKEIKLKNNESKKIGVSFKAKLLDQDGYYKSVSLSTNSTGNYYLLDTGNKKILIYNSKGQKIREFGEEGSGPGEMMNPFQIFSNDQRIFVREEMKVHIYDLNGKFIKDISLTYNGEVAHFQLVANQAALITEKNSKIQIQFIDNMGKKTEELGALTGQNNIDMENMRVMIRISSPYYKYNNNFVKVFDKDYSLGFYNMKTLTLKKVLKKDFEKVERDFSRFSMKIDIDDDSMSKEQIAKQQQEMMQRLRNRMGKYEDDILSVLGEKNGILFIRVAHSNSNELKLHALQNDQFISEFIVKEKDRIYESRIQNGELLLCLRNKEDGPYAKIYTLND